jgi:hypothetical protein
MKDINFEFIYSGTTTVDRRNAVRIPWSYHYNVTIRLHEETETYSSKLIGPESMSLHDLKRKLRLKFAGAAKSAARKKYVAELDARQRAEKNILQQSTDCAAEASGPEQVKSPSTSP